MGFLFSKEEFDNEFEVGGSDDTLIEETEAADMGVEIESDATAIENAADVASDMVDDIAVQEATINTVDGDVSDVAAEPEFTASDVDSNPEVVEVATEAYQRKFSRYVHALSGMSTEDYCGYSGVGKYVSCESVKNNPYQAYVVTHEGFVDTVKAIFKRIIAFFANLGSKLKMWWNKWRLTSGKKVDKAVSAFKSARGKLEGKKLKSGWRKEVVGDLNGVDLYYIDHIISNKNKVDEVGKYLDDIKKENLKKSESDFGKILNGKEFLIGANSSGVVKVKFDDEGKAEKETLDHNEDKFKDRIMSSIKDEDLTGKESKLVEDCKAYSKKLVSNANKTVEKIYELTKTMRELEIDVTKEGDKEKLKSIQKNISAAMKYNALVAKAVIFESSLASKAILAMAKMANKVKDKVEEEKK